MNVMAFVVGSAHNTETTTVATSPTNELRDEVNDLMAEAAAMVGMRRETFVPEWQMVELVRCVGERN